MTSFFRDDVHFLGAVHHSVLPTEVTSRISGTTPSVTNCRVFSCNGAVVSVTNFTGGADGQTIRILGDGATTIVHGTYIKTNTGANKLLAANKFYTFTLLSNVWYEDA